MKAVELLAQRCDRIRAARVYWVSVFDAAADALPEVAARSLMPSLAGWCIRGHRNWRTKWSKAKARFERVCVTCDVAAKRRHYLRGRAAKQGGRIGA